MRTLIIGVIGLLVVACGASNSQKQQVNNAETVPVWERDAENTAYEFYRSVSKTLLRTNQPRRAMKTIAKMITQRPEDPEPIYLMARAYLALDDIVSARHSLHKVIKLDKKYAPAHALMGISYNMTTNHKEAVKYHRTSIILYPENASYHNNLGFSYYLMHDYKNAIAAFRTSIEIDPSVRRVHNNLGFALAQQGKMPQALQSFKLAGVPAQAYNNLGFVYEERGKLEQAYKYYLQALALDPVLVQARRNLTRVCEALEKPFPELEELK